jgi:hypothetical protein
MNDEQLMAYADGELDAERRAAVDAALAADPALAERLRHMQALRTRLQAAFDPVLAEPVPARLRDAVAVPPVVVDLASERARRRPLWALAASLFVGIAVGVLGARWGAADDPLRLRDDGALLAQGPLDALLPSQPAGAAGAQRVALSFVDRDGVYCRAFVLEGRAPLAGLACRGDDGWRVQALAAAQPAGGAELRPAASALPAALLRTIDERIAGEALDAGSEAAALRSGWRR